jgi:hypothetical protein
LRNPEVAKKANEKEGKGVEEGPKEEQQQQEVSGGVASATGRK